MAKAIDYEDEYSRVRELQNAGFACPHCGSRPSGHYLHCSLLSGLRTDVRSGPVDGVVVNWKGQPELTKDDQHFLKELAIKW
jgi:hypothetical protein